MGYCVILYFCISSLFFIHNCLFIGLQSTLLPVKNLVAACGVCSKSFKSELTLKVHYESVHNGVKYSCETCGKSFTSNSYLKNHIKTIHEGLNNYKCDSCGLSFSTNSSMNFHMKKIHGISSKSKKGNDDFNESNNTSTDMVFVPANGARVSKVIPAAEQVKKKKYYAPKFTKVLIKSTTDKSKTGEMMKSMSVPAIVPKMMPAYLPAMVPKMIPAGNQGYTTTQYSGNQENSQQEQQGNNIEYQNDSNEDHAPNDVQLGYQPDDEDGDNNVDTFAPCTVCYQKKCRYISKQSGHLTHKCICDACQKWKGRNKDKILNLDCSRKNKCNRADPVKIKNLCNNCRMYRVRLMGHL